MVIKTTTRTIEYTRNGRRFRRRLRGTTLKCAHCHQPLSGRKSPERQKSSILVVGGKHYHRTCWVYYRSNCKKGSGYIYVPRIMRRRV